MTIVSEQRNSVDPINFIRVLAIIIIYMLHTSLFSAKLVNLWESGYWTFIFKPPAWAGVWILFIVSGYLVGKGFASERYTLKAKDIKKFYVRRIVKVWIPVIFFIFLVCVLVCPDLLIENPIIIIRFLTCTFNDNNVYLGPTWFVFTLMWLYLIAPLICFVMQKIKQNCNTLFLYLLLCVVIMAGFSYRIITFIYSYDDFFLWHTHINAAPYSNLDFFIFGIILSYITINRQEDSINDHYIFKLKNNHIKLISFVVLMASILLNGYLYYIGRLPSTSIYRFIFPSLYICSVGLFLYAFDYQHNITNLPVTFQNIKNNPARLIDWFSGISFEFYLFHSLIIASIYKYIYGSTPLIVHLKLLFIAGIITVIFAYGYSRIFRKARPSVA